MRVITLNKALKKNSKRPGAGYWNWLAVSDRKGGMEIVVAFFAAIWLLTALLAFGARNK